MTLSSQRIRLGIVGVGEVGKRHLSLAQAEPACRVVALADPAPEAADIASAAGLRHYDSCAAMADRENLDGAIVAAPTQQHASVGMDLIARRVPMLMEKPFTDTVEAGLAVAAAAESEGVAVCVGHHRRFDPAVTVARRILLSGTIGRLIGVSGIWAVRKPDSYYKVGWRRRPGGGPVLINLIHDIDLLRHVCGEVETVYAETTPGHRGLEVEDSGAILIRLRGGVRCTVSFSDASPSPWGWERGTGDNPAVPPSGQNCYRFFGSAGSFEFPRIRLWRHEAGGEPGWGRRILAEDRPVRPRAALKQQLRHFCDVARGFELPIVGPRDALRSLAATQAVISSARRGHPVSPKRIPSA